MINLKLIIIGSFITSLLLNTYLYRQYNFYKNEYYKTLQINNELNDKLNNCINQNNELQKNYVKQLKDYKQRLDYIAKKLDKANKIKEDYMNIVANPSLDECSNLKYLLDKFTEVEKHGE